MMGRMKTTFKLLFVLVAISSIYVGINFFIDLHRYFQLSAQTSAEFKNWEVEKKQKAGYLIVATYHFKAKNTSYYKRRPISEIVYPNRCLANEHMEKWKKEQQSVWFNPQNPHQSAILKPFPFKKGIHLLLCIGILVYFLWLNFYVKNVHPDLSSSQNSSETHP